MAVVLTSKKAAAQTLAQLEGAIIIGQVTKDIELFDLITQNN
jgi:hypothetical protein